MSTWFLWARKWFTGPIRQIQAEAAGIDISEPGMLEEAEKRGQLSGLEAGNGGRTLLEGVKGVKDTTV